MLDSITVEEKNSLQRAWSGAAITESTPAGPEKAAFRGVNLRLDLLKALQATWETIKIATKVKLALYTAPDLATMLEIGVESISAAHTILESLVQTMRPIDYVTYIVLSQKPAGMTQAELESAVNDLLDHGENRDELSWYLRISADRFARASQARQGKWMDKVLEKLSDVDMIEREGDLIRFKSRNFKFGWQPD
ncbi:hypothetical protein [Bradyrhizobium sp. CCBAU 11434]|uniref:hypothetical protein n=1 Tax=Bradyrhizobium sp. CCBAU 11434 TaxID=1630885 RepID=UPI00230673FE|nr:hypothetical protein [Bradyrhizobium sp. CCBAU 11434]